MKQAKLRYMVSDVRRIDDSLVYSIRNFEKYYVASSGNGRELLSKERKQ